MGEQTVTELLARLREKCAAAGRTVTGLAADQRAALAAAQEASAQLAELERQALGGMKVSGATRRHAEDALSAAQARAAEPWAERMTGARAAVRDREKELRAHSSQR
jgi:hypothetical protein